MTQNKFTHLLSRLLTPPATACLACGRTSRAESPYAGVCSSCAGAIPWIRNPRCTICGRHVGCPDCCRNGEEPEQSLFRNRSAVAYNDEMRNWLAQLKYRGDERYAPVLAAMMMPAYRLLQEEMGRLTIGAALNGVNGTRTRSGGFNWKADALVPVPVSAARLAERGFNQAQKLAETLSSREGIPLLPLLKRTHHTDKQSFKTRAERMSNMKDAFCLEQQAVVILLRSLAAKTPASASPVQIVIVDDIYTTGSTLRACAKVIREGAEQAGVQVQVTSVTWARS